MGASNGEAFSILVNWMTNTRTHKNEQELEKLHDRFIEQQKTLQDTQKKLSELRDSLTSSKGSK